MTDTMTSQNIDLSSWDTVYTPFCGYRLSFGFLSLEDGADKFSRNVGKILPLLAMY